MQHRKRPYLRALLPAGVERQIAAQADCDVRTLRRWCHGLPIKGEAGERIGAAVALAARGEVCQ